MRVAFSCALVLLCVAWLHAAADEPTVTSMQIVTKVRLTTDRISLATHSKGRHVILVEDNRAMRDALKIYLELDEHEVHTAASMAELDELLDTLEASPSIIISDFHLGAHDRGSDAIDRIRQHFKCVLPAILLTGDTSSVPARLAGESGIRMLNKPVDGERLVAVVDELLGSHAQ